MRTARGPPPRSVCRGGLPSEELGDLRLRAGGHGLCLVRRFSGLIIPQKPWDVVAAELAEYRASYCQVNGTDAPPTGGRRLNFWADGKAEEGAIWAAFLVAVQPLEDFVLLHYGSYEAKFIERMEDILRLYARTLDEKERS